MAVLHKNAEDISFDLRRYIIDRDAQRFVFQCEQFTKSYDPTQAQWNWFKGGIEVLQASFPNVTGLDFPAYKPELHPNAGHWE